MDERHAEERLHFSGPQSSESGIIFTRAVAAYLAGVQIGTIDALLAQLCVRHELTLLTTDKDFHRVAAHYPLAIWRQGL